MQRKTRRKIKRRKRNKYTSQRRKGFVGNLIHFFLKGRVTDKYTKITTLLIILLELYWVVLETTWFAIEMFWVE